MLKVHLISQSKPNVTKLTMSVRSSYAQDNHAHLNTTSKRNKNSDTLQRPLRDFNYPDKRVRYLAQANTDFSFIGPDKDQISRIKFSG